MKKKIICIGIVSMFLLISIGVLPVIGIELKENSKMVNTSNQPQADLTIGEIDYSLKKNDFNEDYHLTLYVEIKNIGNYIAFSDNPWKTRCYVNDYQFGDDFKINALNPGETKTASFVFSYWQLNRDTEYKIKIITDYDDVITEPDEDNNVIEVTQKIGKNRIFNLRFPNFFKEIFNQINIIKYLLKL
jgi:hypothetical protein